jgi:teichuronic acid biosynthesis glycosyltransferase TuaC
LGGIVQGVYPTIRILDEPGNQGQRKRMERLRIHLLAVALVAGAASLASMVCAWMLLRIRRSSWAAAVARIDAQAATSTESGPLVVVFTNLFPHAGTPGAGLFIRERMFRVSKSLPMVVVVPVPWFPLQGLIRRYRPHFRPPAPRSEVIDGVPIILPRFFSIPGMFRCLDGMFMAIACWPLLRRLQRAHPRIIIDAHFAFPTGYAGVVLGKWLGLPVTITMRGTEVSLSADPCRRQRMTTALKRATRVISVSESLRQQAGALGADLSNVQVIGNGVDLARFHMEEAAAARARFGIAAGTPVLISVGGLVERKGFHRVIAVLPELMAKHPGLLYLIVGGSSPEGDMSASLRRQVTELKLDHVVRFLGPLPPDDVHWPLSAANVFVLATSNEGWANVFLEAMACGLPVVATNVGGNSEVVCRPELGTIFEFGDARQLCNALDEALSRDWDRDAILGYASENAWDRRVADVLHVFREVATSYFGVASTGSRMGQAHE